MSSRHFVALPLEAGACFELPPDTARHVQVLRCQPGHRLVLFNGDGRQWQAEVTAMGRREVAVRVLDEAPAGAPEPACAVTLALGMPANERMDALVEKATELGAAAIRPLHTSRSVLRLSGERAERRQAHWQGVAVAAAEQCGRLRVPAVAPVAGLADWLGASAADPAAPVRLVLSLGEDALPLARALPPDCAAVHLLSGPEGGLDAAEEALARAAGFRPVSLGPRTLRADTAPLAALAWIGLRAP
jgi:16S rRNA (uracil1498-N3)-methyltransferase